MRKRILKRRFSAAGMMAGLVGYGMALNGYPVTGVLLTWVGIFVATLLEPSE